jgi:tetratricopeptide (TPR) repeat protein
MKSHSGERFLARRKINSENFMRAGSLILTSSLALLLGACASPGPTPVASTDDVVDSRVRDPARQDSEGVQVFPLQNPAVRELLADAETAEAMGDFGQAATLLERALRIQPRDPEVLQSLAEVSLHIADYEQALSFATRSYDLGPRVGEICSRNWHTISVSREQMGDRSGSREAASRAKQCMSTKPRSL